MGLFPNRGEHGLHLSGHGRQTDGLHQRADLILLDRTTPINVERGEPLGKFFLLLLIPAPALNVMALLLAPVPHVRHP